MPHLLSGTLNLPFSGRMPRSRRTSLQGAQIAVTRAGSQCARMLLEYEKAVNLTDLEMAERIGIPESRVSARRNNLIARKLVCYAGEERKGRSGADSCCYTLTNVGRAVAADLARATR